MKHLHFTFLVAVLMSTVGAKAITYNGTIYSVTNNGNNDFFGCSGFIRLVTCVRQQMVPYERLCWLENNSKAEKANYAVFPGVDGIEQLKYPFGWARFNKNDEKILFSAPATGNGKSYTLVFTQTTGEEDPKKVNSVYLIANDGTFCNDWQADPGDVEALIYHDLGKQDEYCGLKVSTGIVKNGKWTGITKTEEIRIDNKTAQRVIDFLAGDSGWNNDTYLYFTQTKSRKLLNF